MGLRTPCYDWHVEHGGRMVDFAGWDMPVQYTSITDEHHAVRKNCGLFDVSHMARLKIAGPDDAQFIDSLITNDITGLKPGEIRYSLMTNTTGGVLDDILVYRFDDDFLMVVNASNRAKIVDWLAQHQSGFDVTVADLTIEQAMIAVQGPNAVSLLSPLVNDAISSLKYYTGIRTTVDSAAAIVSRTGYTGEDGFEVILPADKAAALWQTLIAAGAQAAGLGCRDTLRLEAGMPLYGHELNETTDPLSAGLAFAVKLDGRHFPGSSVLADIKKNGPKQRRVGLELSGKRIAREHAAVLKNGETIGEVTSGTFSPTLEKTIAMAYVSADQSKAGNDVQVDIRGASVEAKIVKIPFYKRG
ncbi:MAG: glycine cleavage system aminomethyltransferase GcvT [Planctomycetaceae bacterium]